MNSAAVLAAAETEQDLQVELVRMCVAEAGYDPGLVQPHPSPATGFTFVIVGGRVPADVCWRARELVGIGKPKCFACTDRDRMGTTISSCGADRRFAWGCSDGQGSTGRHRSGGRPRQLPTRL